MDEVYMDIEYEMTIALKQFENMKPRIKVRCHPDNAQEMMARCRKALQKEYIEVKKLLRKKQEGNNENKN